MWVYGLKEPCLKTMVSFHKFLVNGESFGSWLLCIYEGEHPAGNGTAECHQCWVSRVASHSCLSFLVEL